MPPPAAPFEVATISVLSVSATGGITFNGPVEVLVAGTETAIVDGGSITFPILPASGPAATIVPTSWPGLHVGDPWSFNPPPVAIGLVPPATGFAASSGVVGA